MHALQLLAALLAALSFRCDAAGACRLAQRCAADANDTRHGATMAHLRLCGSAGRGGAHGGIVEVLLLVVVALVPLLLAGWLTVWLDGSL